MYTKLRSSGILSMTTNIYTKMRERARENNVCTVSGKVLL